MAGDFRRLLRNLRFMSEGKIPPCIVELTQKGTPMTEKAGKLVRNIARARGTTIRRACMAQKPYKSEFCQGKSAWIFDLGGTGIMTCCTPCKDLYVKADQAEGNAKG